MTPKHRGNSYCRPSWCWPLLMLCLLGVTAHAKTDSSTVDHFQAPFHPGVTFGGFGGGDCKVTHTPVIFIHGRQDTANDWLIGESNTPSIYQLLISAGYNSCELFGITYIPRSGRTSSTYNPLQPHTFTLLHQFITRVQRFTHSRQVDIVGYDVGVVAALATLVQSGSWNQVRKVINIAGPLRGLPNCINTKNNAEKTSLCSAQSLDNAFHFGLFPSEASLDGYNEWTSDTGVKSLRSMPQNHSGVRFYTLSAGVNDELLCPSKQNHCADSATFSPASNVLAQLEWQDDKINHETLKQTVAASVVKMLITRCKGISCSASEHHVVINRP
ncbi:alpha/beta hydrolase family protein [Vibrio tritonius]|uniref:hypothetical protein n=1 Tax=Vibrio tritonius TaxID=1435069 RepID=UPI0009E70096|nr:hypothetical protein [Vibrio tritonius]